MAESFAKKGKTHKIWMNILCTDQNTTTTVALNNNMIVLLPSSHENILSGQTMDVTTYEGGLPSSPSSLSFSKPKHVSILFYISVKKVLHFV